MSLFDCGWNRIDIRKLTALFFVFLFGFAVITMIGTHPHLTRTTINILQRTDNSCCSSSYWDALLDSESLKGSQLLEYLKWTNRSSCQLIHDIGGVMLKNPSGIDGQKAVCLDPQVAPKPKNCLVYSFGINDEWSFDEQMERYGCQVFAFDPSMDRGPHQHSANISFYDWGLSDREITAANHWKLRSLSSIYNNLTARHGNQIIDYLKIDVEYAEWFALPQIIESGILSKVRQLGLEVHLISTESINRNLEFVKQLRSIEKLGFVRFDSKYNPWTITNFNQLGLVSEPFAYEIAWYNNKLLHLSKKKNGKKYTK